MFIREVKLLKLSSLLLILMLVLGTKSYGQSSDSSDAKKDTIFRSGLLDSMMERNDIISSNKAGNLDIDRVNKMAYVSVQQMLKGNLAGLYVQEPSGEPGTAQYMYVRGLVAPLLSAKDINGTQPTVYLNGIPMLKDNAFSYDMQHYDFATIGPSTNIMSIFDNNDIESIQLLKDPAVLAKLGPLATNGAIWITSKTAHSGPREISVNSYYGIAVKPVVTPINASWENNFRQPFYQKYGTVQDMVNYPTYLKDSSDLNYYGPANWVDDYYKNAPIHSVDLSLTGGSQRANFRFMANNTRSAGVADGTGLDRYGLSFFINMAPLKWFTVSAMIKGNRLQRQRNKNVRDRLAETGYIPDLSNPLPPNKDVYGDVYLKYFDGTIDDNKSNAVQGYVSAAANFRNLQLSTRVAFDYNEGIRDVFWPSTLMENNNYLSNYFGYNQRFLVDNSASYTLNLSSKSKFVFEAGQSITKDRYKYDYIYGYNTPNDYIKIFSIDLSKIAQGISPYSGISPYMFRFTDKEGFVLSSVYGKIGYSAMNNALKLSALVRNDGSSAYPANNRWLPSPVFSASYDFKKQILSNFNAFSTLSLNASYGKFGKLLDDDRFAAGPQYVVDLGWSSETNMGSYRGMAGLSRPYTTGWVGYDVPWAYSNKLDIGLNTGWWDNRVLISVDYYNNDDKNQLLAMPAFASSGYTSMYESGMWVNNKGLDATLSVQILRSEQGLNWSLNANVNQNKNVLKALPGGAHEVVIGSNKLEVGHSVDSYWLYENEGVYNSTSDIPVGATTGKLLNFNGIDFSAGDAKWNDENNDGVINDKDKVLKGHYMPTVSGGFGSSLSYKGLSLEFQFYYALGRQVLNQLASSRFDFINSEANNDINSVKEITFWQKPFDPSDYPMYNPWSSVDPYRVDQDLFLQNASFLKLRNLSIGYDISKIGALKRAGFKSSQIYVSATNLFTITPFKNGDPELSLYNGVYNGYGMTIPKCYTIGIKLNL